MKRGFIFSLVTFIFISFARADEGMWLPYLLKLLNEEDMKSKGLHISADDIYHINKSSLKDAIVLFGGGCTGEIVSEQGLLLTNHHCGYGKIQAHSSLENDYLANGFWAMKKEEELPNPGLTVTLLISMSDVTQEVLKNVTETMTEEERDAQIEKNSKSIIEKNTENTHYQAVIKPIYNGNQYLLFINEVFQDIRLVGAPPSSIGKFGGDTDNWMWPRHTGDFSIFRIYTGKDGKPAPFSKENIPYIPKKHLSISLKGIEPEDFTFVFGYPGSTEQFLTSWAVELVLNQTNPIAIDLRTQRLNIIKKYMENDRLTRIQYSAKAAGIANGWKKWIGENKGLERLNTIENKKLLESQFTTWITSDANRKQLYGDILPKYEQLYKEMKNLSKENSYFMEGFYGIEIVRFAWLFVPLIEKVGSGELTKIKEGANALKGRTDGFFKDYNAILDKEIFVLLMQVYYDNCDKSILPEETKKLLKSYRYNMTALANDIYSKSIFLQQDKLSKIMEDANSKTIVSLKNDILLRLIKPVFDNYIDVVVDNLKQYDNEIKRLDRLWTKALMEMQSDKTFYPDANLTLRVTYGKINGYNPRDGVSYKYYTTVDGIMEKEDVDIYDYAVDPKLKQLYINKDYGRYAMKNGDMPVAFVATNHTTGGNSGSPV
ncbi:MAG: S46 family peptidase, partial [Bacteroidales bacterium]|nr:S46 family peptidase [Bacteroidales bacterium]